MKRSFLLASLILLISVLYVQAQQQSKGKVIIIEEYIDENGEKQTKRTEKEWDDMDDMNRYLDLEIPGSFDIDEYLHDDGNTFIFPPSGASGFSWGSEVKPYLGVTMVEHSEGAQIRSIAAGSPADLAGLQVDDILISVDGIVSATPRDVVNAINDHDVDDIITIKYDRDGKTVTTDAILAANQQDLAPGNGFFGAEDLMRRLQDMQMNFPNMENFMQSAPSDARHSWGLREGAPDHGMQPRLGATVQNHQDAGVEIVTTSPGSLAEKAGLRPGDVIISYDQGAVNSVDELQAYLSSQQWDSTVQIEYLRDGNPKRTTIEYKRPAMPRPKNLKRL